MRAHAKTAIVVGGVVLTAIGLCAAANRPGTTIVPVPPNPGMRYMVQEGWLVDTWTGATWRYHSSVNPPRWDLLVMGGPADPTKSPRAPLPAAER